MSDGQLKAEMLSYSRAQGVFAGVDVSGGVLKPDTDDNTELYGRRVADHVAPQHHVVESAVLTVALNSFGSM